MAEAREIAQACPSVLLRSPDLIARLSHRGLKTCHWHVFFAAAKAHRPSIELSPGEDEIFSLDTLENKPPN